MQISLNLRKPSFRLFGLLLILSGGFFISVTTYAQVDEAKIDTVKQNCVTAQVEIQRVRYNDAAVRVNRGQGYETLLSKMINPLNSRVTANGYNEHAASLTATATKYQKQLAKFKKDYDAYDDTLASLLRLKCVDKPEVFYGSLEAARTQRASLSVDIANLTQIISEYQAGAKKLQDSL